MNSILCYDWLPQWKSKRVLFHVRQALFSQDGWILALFSFCMFMDLDSVLVHKKARRPLSIHLRLELGQ